MKFFIVIVKIIVNIFRIFYMLVIVLSVLYVFVNLIFKYWIYLLDEKVKV